MNNYAEHYNRLKMYAMFIYTMYRRLAKFEYEGKRDSVNYLKTLETINNLKQSEKEYYDTLCRLGDKKQLLIYNILSQKEMLGQISQPKQIYDPSYLFSNKLKSSDVILMRVSAKITDLFRHMHYQDPATLNIYDTYAPIRDKYFLDVLSSQIDDFEYKDYRKMLIDAKYNYAFVYDKDVCELLDYDKEDEDNENIDLIVSLGTVLEYKDKFAKLNNRTLLSPNNRKRFLLDVNYIRACALGVPNEYLEVLKYSIEGQKEISEGSMVFVKILEMAIEDKNIFDEGDIPYKRKF